MKQSLDRNNLIDKKDSPENYIFTPLEIQKQSKLYTF
jgi:hypothetical protein